MSAVRVLLLDGADRGRCGEQRLHPVLGRHTPERTRIRCADRLALVEHGRRAEHQRAVDDVGVADHPTHVGGRPVDVARFNVVDVTHGPQQGDGVPAVVADDALGPARRARRVEHVQRVGGRDGHRIHRFGLGHHRVPVEVAAGQGFAWPLIPLHDDTGRRGVFGDVEGGVDHRLVVDDAGRLDAAGRGDDGGGPGIVDAGGQLMGGEPAEHHRVDGTQPRAGQHRDDGLGNHRHVDDDAVTLIDAEGPQCAREPRCLIEQFAVGVGALRAGDRRVVDQRGLLAAAGFDVTVQRIGASVELAIGEPPIERRVGVVEDLLRLPGPGHRAGGVGPERTGIGDADVEQFAIAGHTRTVARNRLPKVRFMTSEPPQIDGLRRSFVEAAACGFT